MASSEKDHYALLGLLPDATDPEIKKAYRKLALKYHPDKAGADNKEAAEMFHDLSVAHDTLTNSASRNLYDTAHKARLAQKARIHKMDTSRRRQREELDAREEAVKRRKAEATAEAVARANEIDRLREENANRMRAEEERRRVAEEAVFSQAREEKGKRDEVEAASPEECTLKLKWKRKRRDYDAEEIETLFGRYGVVDRVLMSSKGKGSGLVVFKSLAGAYAAISDSQSETLKPFEVAWASGSEPVAVKHLNSIPPPAQTTAPRSTARTVTTTLHPPTATSITQSAPQPSTTPQAFPSFAAFPTFPAFAAAASKAPTSYGWTPPTTTPSQNDYESVTLMRMRQAEREKLKAQIRDEEAQS